MLPLANFTHYSLNVYSWRFDFVIHIIRVTQQFSIELHPPDLSTPKEQNRFCRKLNLFNNTHYSLILFLFYNNLDYSCSRFLAVLTFANNIVFKNEKQRVLSVHYIRQTPWKLFKDCHNFNWSRYWFITFTKKAISNFTLDKTNDF